MHGGKDSANGQVDEVNAGNRRESSAAGNRPHTLYGVNVSGWLVLESWVTPSLFASTGAFDEQGMLRSVGEERYAALVKKHRDTFITQRDFAQMAARGFTAVRLSIPWHCFGEASLDAPHDQGCLAYIDNALTWAQEYGLAVLLSVASVPGATRTPDGRRLQIEEHGTWRTQAVELTARLGARYGERESFLGVEPLEEPVVQRRRGWTVTPGIPAHALRNFYRDCYEALRDTAGERPVLAISAAGEPGAWRRFMAQRRYTNVWLDIHPYHYTQTLDAQGPYAARRLANRTIAQVAEAKTSGLPVMVGEWSAALPAGTSSTTPEGRLALERIFTAGQLEAFRGLAAWFFQTWKTESKLSAWDARLALSSFERGMFD
jgi:glucan 1,3-beta-glucosidase